LCYGNVTINADLNKGYCEIMGYNWFQTTFFATWPGIDIGDAGSVIRSVAVGDLDGDGDFDIVSRGTGWSVYVWVNDGTPFDDPWSGTNIGSTGSGVNSVAVGDLDGDGDFDIVSGDSGFDIYVWENTAINGTNGPCCGDDATDNFYNSSHICTPDTSQGLCEYLSYNWFTGNITGTNASCCGDDGVYDDFYNGTIGTTTHFCYLGTFTEQWIDVNQTICEKYSYNWFSDNVNYPGTYSFTSDEVGNDPSGWIINEAGGSVQVISDLGNHNKVLKLDYDTGTVDARQIFTAGGQSSGIVEFWVRTTDAGIRTAIYIYDGSLGDDLFLVIENDKFRWYAGGATSHDICAAADDTWYHLKITFDTAGTWSLTVDGTEYNGFTFRGAPTDMDNFRIFTTADKIDYIDAVGYSWDPSYSVGDNALAACCGDDNVADIFYNDSQMCSYGGVIFDADHNYYQDWLGDYINYTSGRGVCELKGYDWFETGLPNAWNGTNIGACPNQPRGVVVGDLDNDGDLDIISGDWSHNVYIWDNNGTPFNEAWSSRDIGNADADINDVAVGDLDGDGDLDIVSGDSGYSNVGKVRVWRNDGTPFDDDWFSINAGSTSVINDLGVALGDLDGDGDLDIVSGNNDGGIHVWENDGFPFDDPWFSNYVGSAGSSVFGIAIADLDGDGDLDIISGTLSGSLRVWENDGTPFTDAWSSNSLGSYGSSVAVGDLDGDGDLDLITDRANGNNVYAWENDGTPFIGAWSRSDVGTGNYVRTVVVGDMDNDGDLDILGGDFDRRVRVWVNDGSPFDDVWSLINVGTVSGYVYAIDVGDLDGDGDLDIVSGDQNDDVYVWENFGINGTNGPCCGDDGASDLFYNSSIYCLEGVIGTDLDSSPIACEYFSYDWLSGTTVGTNDPCCGDDGVDDDFYNATDGYGGYCIDGVYAFGDPDDFQSICEYLSNDWFEGATDPIGKCCGDDDSIDDFGNYSLSCCCNGVVIGDGDPCDLDQDGNIDSVCLNGYYQGYIMSDYSPEFLIKNTGNVTVCFSSTEILNTTLNYSPDYGNPDCITPGNSGLFKFHFGRFACDDLDKPFNMIANFTYETDSLISNLNFIVRSPLDIERIEPSIVASLPVNVNEFEDLLITLSNKGSETINYKVDMQASSDTLLLLKIPEGQYTIDELKAEEFSILPRTSIIFELMIAALSEGEKTVAITFNSTGECINVTDSITFKIQGIEVGKGFLDIFEIPGLDWIAIIILMIISSIIVYYKVLKK
jgi:hypothetical protein